MCVTINETPRYTGIFNDNRITMTEYKLTKVENGTAHLHPVNGGKPFLVSEPMRVYWLTTKRERIICYNGTRWSSRAKSHASLEKTPPVRYRTFRKSALEFVKTSAAGLIALLKDLNIEVSETTMNELSRMKSPK